MTMDNTNVITSNIASSSSDGVDCQQQLYSYTPINFPINSLQHTWANTDTYTYAYADDQLNTVELKTIDGKRHIIQLSRNSSLEDIEERVATTRKFSFKFPFIITEKKPYVHFKISNYYRDLNDKQNKAKEFDVDCNLSAFCKLVGLSYKGFSETLVEDAIENG